MGTRILSFVALMILALPLLASTEPDCDKIRNDDLMCLACNIYHEAAVEPFDGKLGVAYVTSNRRLNSHYPNSYCGVVWDYILTRRTKKAIAQFSWTLDGKSDRVRSGRTFAKALEIAKRFALPKEVKDEMCPQIEATRKMREYVKEEYGIDRTHLPDASCKQYESNIRMKLIILQMTHPDPTSGATNYHADYVDPSWANQSTMVKTAEIKRHIFYINTKIAKLLSNPEKPL